VRASTARECQIRRLGLVVAAAAQYCTTCIAIAFTSYLLTLVVVDDTRAWLGDLLYLDEIFDVIEN